jgi:hypothetical protein
MADDALSSQLAGLVALSSGDMRLDTLFRLTYASPWRCRGCRRKST